MKAAVYRRFGGPDVVSVTERPRPQIGEDEVLIRVRASTVSAADHRARSRDLPKGLGAMGPLSFGVFRPRKPVLGMDVAGVVESVGDAVTAFRPGDEVMALLGFRFGGHAEFARIRADGAIAAKPTTLTFEDSVALVFGGTTAISFLQRVAVTVGTRVLVNGASGSVGSAVVQLARHRGARVTAVTSGRNHDLALSLGAEDVIDYQVDDFTDSGRHWDVIVDCVGNAGFERVGAVLAPGGALLLVISDLAGMLHAKRDTRSSGGLVTASGVPITGADLAQLATLADAGALQAVVDRVYPLEQVVDAHSYVDTGRKRGNVVLAIG